MKRLAVSTVRKAFETIGFQTASNMKEHFESRGGLSMGLYGQLGTGSTLYLSWDPNGPPPHYSNLVVQGGRWTKGPNVHIVSYYAWPVDSQALWKILDDVKRIYSELCGAHFKGEHWLAPWHPTEVTEVANEKLRELLKQSLAVIRKYQLVTEYKDTQAKELAVRSADLDCTRLYNAVKAEEEDVESNETVQADKVTEVQVKAARNALLAGLRLSIEAGSEDNLTGACKTALAHLGIHVVEEEE